jgi:hypothetical protein
MTKKLDLREPLLNRRTFGFFEEFEQYATGGSGTSLAADSGSSVAVTAGATGGVLALTTGATDNNEAAYKRTGSAFLMVADKPLVLEARIQYAEASTNAANVAIGLCDSAGANLLVDNGAGPKTSYSGAMLFKVDGSNSWECHSSKSTTQTRTLTNSTAGGSSYQTLRIEIQPVSSTTAEVTFWIDGVQAQDVNGKPIKHYVTMTSAVAMQPFLYVKDGSGTGEVLSVDYLATYQLR